MQAKRIVLALAAAAATAGAQQTSSIDRAGWIAGCWELRAGSRVTIEMWMPPSGGLMLGASRTTNGGALAEFEQLRIAARGDTLVYIAAPSGQTVTEFRSTTVSNTSLVFENRAHDFPQVISYRRVGTDSLVARVEGPGANNTTQGFNLPMRRASCTIPPAPGAPPDTLVMDAVQAPDARQLLVVKGVLNNWEVYLTAMGGGNQRKLTDHAAVDYMPAWSPDGSRIAFVSTRDGHQEIYTMLPNGSGLTRLTNGTAHNSEPAWSPDGRHIAFRSERDSRPQVYVMNSDGSEQRALTRDSTRSWAPAWSPDGRKILFASSNSGRSDIYVMNSDGSQPTRLTTTTQGHSGAPAWSPDGSTIAFWSTRDGNDEVYLMNADGSGARNITNNPARDTPLGWTRDGANVLIRSTRDRTAADIYRLSVDGSTITRLNIVR